MTLRRCSRSVDGTIPIQALLYNDEELLSSQEGVGIYDGAQKSPNHQSGTIHVTTHRLFYLSAHRASSYSLAVDLSCISQTDYYAGLFKSSAKVTLHISVAVTSPGDSGPNDGPDTPFESWECGVCAYRNPPGLSPAAARICGLCGIPRDSFPAAASPHQLSTSLPTSTSLPSLLPPSAPSSSSGTLRRQPNAIACPACTFLNHPSLRECEICTTELPQAASLGMKSAPSSRPASPDPSDDEEAAAARLIKISFRKGGDKAFYAVLRRSLKSKAWAIGASTTAPGDTSGAGSGITGILRTVESSAQERASGMNDAFQDLEALMVKAKDMVRLAADLNERLTASSASSAAEPEAATFIRSSLSQLGLQMADAPVTQDMASDEQRWMAQLARELASVLKGLMRERGVIALDEVWGGWNRARGVALLPPSTLLQVVPHLPQYTDPTIVTRTFPSGLRVLHTPPYAPAAFAARLAQLLAEQPKTITEIASKEKVAVGLAAELVGELEGEGGVCRDDEACMIRGGGAEVRFWGNVFKGYVWDGQEKERDEVVY
ncbi:EAP30/Vps36 family-domain-containing protein [Mycena rosella]|uniref:Vacuolar protein-sorting-associated protein 36 n=1 Tax=Mycena rosella TaxID=1033263 RepID=A0AAD7GG05_MYCRO|nr:EAP30/Vps36 family-domain-containing protein [Mycena rosella]